jgi:hypothetical protein
MLTRAGGVAQVVEHCFASLEPSIQTPVPPKTNKKLINLKELQVKKEVGELHDEDGEKETK